MAKRMTNEEKIAQNIGKAVSDLTLDIEAVGKYLAQNVPSISYNRLIVIAEAAEAEKESIYVRNTSYPLW
jgi:phage regulator Rha-like protein